MTKPTLEGLRRYPSGDGYFDVGNDDPQPCTCTATCAPRCAGTCGCAACDLSFVAFCDVAGLVGSSGFTVPEDEAVRRYQHGV